MTRAFLKDLKDYLKQHSRVVFLYIAFSCIFILFFVLYQIPAAAVLYASAVCGFLGFVVLIPHFRKFRQNRRQLGRLCTQKEFFVDSLPLTEGILEQDYQELIRELDRRYRELEARDSQKYRDMIEYYTLWAHQIKTPIASMHLNLENEDTTLARDIRSDLMRIEQYADMVLCYLRLDSEDTDYVFREYATDSIVKQALHKFSSFFIRGKIRLEYRPIKGCVLTDEKWILFVLEQVLSNALKYTKAGGSISIEETEPGVLCVRDTGIGIAPEDLPRIFEKGYTGCNGRLQKKASGIGLYLCKRICERLGHKIRAESCIGEGTAVYLDLRKAQLETE